MKKEGLTSDRTLQLIVTEDCNLRCRYCFEQTKSKRSMPVEIALAKVEKYLSLEDEFEGLMIDFSGGEPLLRLDLIRSVVDFVHSRQWRKKHHFSIGSNLTLLTDDIKEWARQHRTCLTICGSLDGTKRAHDLNRSKSYDAVVAHVPFLIENWPNQPVKMTIGPDTIGEVAQGIIEIIEMGLKVEANVVFEDVWGDETRKKALLRVFSDQLDRLVDYFVAHPDLEPPRLVDLGIEYAGHHRENRQEVPPRWCGFGKYMVGIDVDGEEYACHRFTPFGSNRAAVKHAQGEATRIRDRCSDCFFVSVCPSCAGHNWETTADPYLRTTYHCDFIKLQFLATARLKYCRNLERINRILDAGADPASVDPKAAELKAIVEGILAVNQHIAPPF